MLVSDVAARMIAESAGNLHDIEHFLKVYAYARTIGVQERLNTRTQETLELAALTHDIACPLCRTLYGQADGKHQELHGAVLARELLADFPIDEEMRARVAFLVGHHHSPESVDGPDYQILLEADYLVNASESGWSAENIRNALHTLFQTASGCALLKSIYQVT